MRSLLLTLLLLASCGEKSRNEQAASDAETNRFDSARVGGHNTAIPISNGKGKSDFEVEERPEDDLKDVLDDCGLPDVSSPTIPTFDTKMQYKHVKTINAGVAVALVPVTAKLDLRGLLGKVTLDVGVEFDPVSGKIGDQAVTDLTLIEKRGEEIAKAFRGPVTNYLHPINSNFTGIFRVVRCTIIPGARLENRRSGFATDVSFSPGYAPNISPIAERRRYALELGNYRVLNGIKATVTKTDNPALKVGMELVGSSIIEKIPPTKETHMGTIKGDVAYRITNRFGNDKETLAMGMHLWTEYYIDVKRHAFSAIIANVGDDEIMHFIGTYVGDGLPPEMPGSGE
jgi:hypothetical protein